MIRKLSVLLFVCVGVLLAWLSPRADLIVTDAKQGDILYVAISTNVGTTLCYAYTNQNNTGATTNNQVFFPWKMKSVGFRYPSAVVTNTFQIWHTRVSAKALLRGAIVTTNAFDVVETNYYHQVTGTVSVAESNLLYQGYSTNVQDIKLQAGIDFVDDWYVLGADRLHFNWSSSFATNFILQVYGAR